MDDESPPTTPLKGLSIPDDALMEGAAPETETLMDTFSGMAFNDSLGANKRRLSAMTVEASPVNQYWKRQDVQPTPRVSLSQRSGREGDLQKVKKNVFAYNAKLPPRRVLVLSAGSGEDHNTGAHQENALRTALLCGPQGCLRRRLLGDFVEWADAEPTEGRLAPLADLLRVHDYPYLAHLENKCKGEGEMPPFYAPHGMLDTDTPLVRGSLNASRKFCGAALRAVDLVMSSGASQASSGGGSGKDGKDGDGRGGDAVTHAFVLGRPPGHHAGAPLYSPLASPLASILSSPLSSPISSPISSSQAPISPPIKPPI